MTALLKAWSPCWFLCLSFSLPKCGKGKPALVRRNPIDDKSELIACIETGNFAKAARLAAGGWPVFLPPPPPTLGVRVSSTVAAGCVGPHHGRSQQYGVILDVCAPVVEVAL